MQNITSLQILAVVLVSIIGFAFRLGIEYYSKNEKLPDIKRIIFMFIFSMGAALLMFIFTFERNIRLSINLILIWAASFFGSVIVLGLGSIKGDFFAELFKDLLRKWLNSKSDGISKEIYENEEMSKDDEDVTNTEQ